MKSFKSLMSEQKLTEAFNFRPKDDKEIKANPAIPKDWQPFLIDIFKMFGETVVFQTTGKLNKKGEISGSALAGKVRPDEWFKIKTGKRKIGSGFKMEFNPKGTSMTLTKQYGEWDYSINLVAGLGSGVKGPSGAQWESLITHQYNILNNEPDIDKNAAKIANEFYPVYHEPALALAKAFKKELSMTTTMTQFGASTGKLSALWKKHGGTNATPKTDMYTSNYNISLKKAGGSQYASGTAGETLSTFHAALEYMGADGKSKAKIKSIMKSIKDNFEKIQLDMAKGELADLDAGKAVGGNIKKGSKIYRKGKGNKPDQAWSTKDQDEFKKFKDTEQFHKTLNDRIKKDLSVEKEPEFRKWFLFEAMSGFKKFGGSRSTSSICVTFNPDDGTVSKINVTGNGGSKGLSGDTPTLSKELIKKSGEIKLYSAFKSSGTRPYSVLRAHKEQTGDMLVDCTLDSLIRDQIMLDEDVKSLGLNLTEEVIELDEIALLKSVYSKMKNIGKDAKKWVSGFFKKLMAQVNKVLSSIEKLGKRMFEGLFQFLGIEITDASANVPSELADFVNK
ncbi:MAG: hypothetical protein CL464_10840 [Acidimicrobiaceae bacterium]|nr:hypothetical protein [Acidimicrobiaceae bacterium]|tara:strand:- start:371 stop:2056 length:1686 start_codon:yes stop_codon:yes gene_type:complete